LKVIRDGKELTLKVKVGKLESKEEEAGKAEAVQEGKWGLQLEELTPERSRQLGLEPERGVLVVDVRPGSPADEASVQRGDVVLEVNRQEVKSMDDMKEKMARAAAGKEGVLLLIQRGKTTIYAVLKG
jgi:serine protease Do